MNKRNILVVGASAGGFAALVRFVSRLPENFRQDQQTENSYYRPNKAIAAH